MEVGGGGGGGGGQGDKSRKKIPHEIINIKKFLWILTKKSLKPRRKKKKISTLHLPKKKILHPQNPHPSPSSLF